MRYRHTRLKYLIIALLVLSGSPLGHLWAQESISQSAQPLVEKYRILQKNPLARNRAIMQGKQQAFLCAYCHGKDGNSTKPRFPNLASQNPIYLLEQFERFRTGVREDFTGVMQGLVENMPADDKVALAVYYANNPLTPITSNPLLARKGKPLYEKYCKQCHGENGQGTKGYARIAGQQTVYLLETLDLFKDDSRSNLRSRHSDIMTALSRLLTQEEALSITHYLTSLSVKLPSVGGNYATDMK